MDMNQGSGQGPTMPSQPAQSGGGDTTKIFAIIGYIFPILFFIPLVTEAKSQPFARFHANQQLLLLIWYVIANAIGIVPVLGWLAMPILIVIGLVLAIMGIINASQGAMKPLPIIGKYTLLK